MKEKRARLIAAMSAGCTRNELLYQLAGLRKSDSLEDELTKPQLARAIVNELSDLYVSRMLRAYTGENQ